MDRLLGLQHIAWLLRVPWRRAVHSRFHSRAWRPVSRHLAVGFAWPTPLPGARCWRDGPRRSAGGQSCFKIWRFVWWFARQKAIIRGALQGLARKWLLPPPFFTFCFFKPFVMPAYSFEALQPDGKTRKGVLDADTARAARAQLRAQGLAPLDVQVISAGDAQRALGGASRRRAFDSASSLLYILKKDHRVVASVSVDTDFGTNYFFGLAVDQDFQGQGLGSYLLLTSMQDLNELNGQDFQIVVEKQNARALKLYKKLGFKEMTEVFYLKEK